MSKFEVRKLEKNLHIVTDFELLHLSALPLHELLDNEGADRVRGVPLLGVGLDNDSTVHLWFMLLLVL